MTSPNRVAKAYVEITADYDKFVREASTKLNNAFRQVGKNVDPGLDVVGERAGSNFADAFTTAAKAAVATEMEKVAAAAGRGIAGGIDNPQSKDRVGGALRNLITGAFAGIGGLLGSAGSGISKAFGDFFGDQGSAALEKFSGQLLKASGGIGVMLIKLGLAVMIVPHLAAAIGTLVTNLVGLVALLALLPGTIGVLVAAVVPLVIAFEGFGEAIGAIVDGDPEKIATALEKLTPAARGVAREFAALMPYFREIRKIVQEAFFAKLSGQLTGFFTAVGSGNVAQGLGNAASALGRFAGIFFQLGESVAFQRFAGLLFGNSADSGAFSRILGSLEGPIVRLLSALSEVGAATMPTLERVFAKLGEGVAEFAIWLERITTDGSLNEWLAKGLETAGDLKDLLGELLGLFGVMFDNTDDGGERFLQKITKAVADLKEYFESPEGKAALEAMITLANNFADALGLAVDFLEKILTLLAALNVATGGDGGPGVARTATGGSKIGAAYARVNGYAEGGVITKPTFGLIGEAGPEAVVPLSDPSRARAVMAEAGLVPLAENMTGGGMTVLVYLGTEQITDILDTRVAKGLAGAGRQLRNGPRGY